jgi:hypothetical protein
MGRARGIRVVRGRLGNEGLAVAALKPWRTVGFAVALRREHAAAPGTHVVCELPEFHHGGEAALPAPLQDGMVSLPPRDRDRRRRITDHDPTTLPIIPFQMEAGASPHERAFEGRVAAILKIRLPLWVAHVSAIRFEPTLHSGHATRSFIAAPRSGWLVT